MSKRVCIYVRVSTTKQTVENQIQVLREYSDRCGYQITHIYSDNGISGSKGRQDFTWIPNQVVTVDSNPYNKWIKLRYEIKSTDASDGYIRIYANDKLVINETRATLPISNAFDTLRVGIYNSNMSFAAQPWQTQVVYFDGFGLGTTNF